MRLVISLFGLDFLDVELTTGSDEAGEECSLDGGVTGSTVVGFTASPGDQRWDGCGDLGGDDEE